MHLKSLIRISVYLNEYSHAHTHYTNIFIWLYILNQNIEGMPRAHRVKPNTTSV